MKKFLEYLKYIFQIVLYFTGIVFIISYFKKNVPVRPVKPRTVKYKTKPDKKNLSEAKKATRALLEIKKKSRNVL